MSAPPAPKAPEHTVISDVVDDDDTVRATVV